MAEGVGRVSIGAWMEGVAVAGASVDEAPSEAAWVELAEGSAVGWTASKEGASATDGLSLRAVDISTSDQGSCDKQSRYLLHDTMGSCGGDAPPHARREKATLLQNVPGKRHSRPTSAFRIWLHKDQQLSGVSDVLLSHDSNNDNTRTTIHRSHGRPSAGAPRLCRVEDSSAAILSPDQSPSSAAAAPSLSPALDRVQQDTRARTSKMDAPYAGADVAVPHGHRHAAAQDGPSPSAEALIQALHQGHRQ
jgi:hypothetical protein